jgi:hypothetical protein
LTPPNPDFKPIRAACGADFRRPDGPPEIFFKKAIDEFARSDMLIVPLAKPPTGN